MWGPEHKDALDQPGDIGKFIDKGTFKGSLEGWVCTFDQKRGSRLFQTERKYKQRYGHRKCVVA